MNSPSSGFLQQAISSLSCEFDKLKSTFASATKTLITKLNGDVLSTDTKSINYTGDGVSVTELDGIVEVNVPLQNFEETTTLLQNTIEGHKIGDYTNEIEAVVDINETVTTLVNNEDNTYTYTNEEGTETIITIPESEALKFGYPLEDVLADGNRNFDLDGNEFFIDNVGRWDFKTYVGNDFVQIESNISANSFSIWSFTENDFFQANSGSDFKDVRVYDLDGNDFFALTENTDEKSFRLYNRLDNEYFTLVSNDSNDLFKLNSRSGADLLTMSSSLTDYGLYISSFIGNTWVDFQSNNSYSDMRVLNRAGDDFVQFFADSTNHQVFFKAKTATNNDFVVMNSTDALKFFGVIDYEGGDFFILESTDSYKTIRIDIPSKGVGKVLMSDADGFATWEFIGRFGFSGEDDLAGENRLFDANQFDVTITNAENINFSVDDLIRLESLSNDVIVLADDAFIVTSNRVDITLNDEWIRITGIPVYADDTAADGDGDLVSGMLYKKTGDRAIYQKP